MNIDTGTIYTPEEMESLYERIKKEGVKIEDEQFANSVVEISESDIEAEEKETHQVQLDGDSKLAGYARHMRNMRRFVQFHRS